MGDSTLRNMQSDLAKTTSAKISGLTGSYFSLSTVGIKTNSAGKLSLDSDAFNTALAADPTAVSRVFINDNDNSTEGMAKILSTLADKYVDFADGTLVNRVKSIDTQSREIDDQIAKMERRLTSYEDNLNKQFWRLETTMAQLKAQSSYLSNLNMGSIGGSSK